jgi:hypothetical protein
MPGTFFVHLLQAIQILLHIRIRGATVDFEIIPHLAVDLAISLTLGQDDCQSLGNVAAFMSKSCGRVSRV